MKNKIFIILISLFFNNIVFSENLLIESKNISLDKNKETSIFQDEVKIQTEDGKIINSSFAEYNKKTGLIVLKNNIKAIDVENNIIETNYAEYNDKTKIFKTIGNTKIITTKNYIINGKDIILNNKKKFIVSDKKSKITDVDNNTIHLENFEYQTKNNIFKSIGFVEIEDNLGNKYEFSQVYIDTKNKEILGTDIKAFLNDKDFKINEKNKPRIFANILKKDKEQSFFKKSIFTLCDYRKNDKCPPWSIQATEMLHNNKKKTIYYKNAVVKIYDIPVFYIPRLSHPDPTVDRRSGFLPPTFTDTKNLGFGTSIPYFFAINDDKNFTLTSNFYNTENPLFLGEYHQAFKNSFFLADFGYTEGYKKTSKTKKGGEKSHIFSKFSKNFKGKNNSDNFLSLSFQNVSNDKYLKLYKIKSNLVYYSNDTLESSLNFTHEKNDLFFGLNASVYETLKDSYNDKYEYILPELTIDKNLFSGERLGNLDLQTNLKVHNYDTNKLTNFVVNDFNWSSKEIFSEIGIKSKFLGNIKNINYEAKNIDIYKENPTSEFFGALGILSEFNLQKFQNNTNHLITPRILVRYAPGSMRQEEDGNRLNPINAFSLNRLDNLNNYETGFSGTLGFDYKFKNDKKSFDFSVAQVINERENKKMHSKTSMDEKLSDLVGTSKYTINNNFSLNYNFSVDQNYSELNYNEIGTDLNLGLMNLNFNYLQEKKHIGNQDYFKTKLELKNSETGLFTFENKRNLITNSSEFYNLSYEYINDCLRAGLVYRREFYNDSELEPENSLMFKITIVPFGDINSPSFNQ